MARRNPKGAPLCRVVAEYLQDRMAGDLVYRVPVEERAHVPLHCFRAAATHRLPALGYVGGARRVGP